MVKDEVTKKIKKNNQQSLKQNTKPNSKSSKKNNSKKQITNKKTNNNKNINKSNSNLSKNKQSVNNVNRKNYKKNNAQKTNIKPTNEEKDNNLKKNVQKKKVLKIDDIDNTLIVELSKETEIESKKIEIIKKKKNNNIDLIIIISIVFLSLIFIAFSFWNYRNRQMFVEQTKPIKIDNPVPVFEPVSVEPKEEIIEITTAGDCTLGADTNFGYNGQFDWWFKNKAKSNYGYFFEKVKYLFENDDYSYVNLEGTLTTSKMKTKKRFNFKGDPKYTNILISGNIEGVNIANNHSNDYGTVGYNDTKKYLEEAGIDYFGHDSVVIKEIKGKKIALVGYTGVGLWVDKDKDMANTIKKLKNDGVDIVIANFHWGIEYSYSVTSVQRKRAHLAIDSGADIVIGSHPHCLQGMEKYKGKYIVYSLGNFIFGGNSNPKAIGRDCIIVKMFIKYVDDKLESIKLKVIPCSISSTKSRNNYQPVVVTGSEYKRMIKVINKYSINYKYNESEA